MEEQLRLGGSGRGRQSRSTNQLRAKPSARRSISGTYCTSMSTANMGVVGCSVRRSGCGFEAGRARRGLGRNLNVRGGLQTLAARDSVRWCFTTDLLPIATRSDTYRRYHSSPHSPLSINDKLPVSYGYISRAAHRTPTPQTLTTQLQRPHGLLTACHGTTQSTTPLPETSCEIRAREYAQDVCEVESTPAIVIQVGPPTNDIVVFSQWNPRFTIPPVNPTTNEPCVHQKDTAYMMPFRASKRSNGCLNLTFVPRGDCQQDGLACGCSSCHGPTHV